MKTLRHLTSRALYFIGRVAYALHLWPVFSRCMALSADVDTEQRDWKAPV